MATNKKPRKRYRPMRMRVAPLQMLGERDPTPLEADQTRDLMIGAHSALAAVESGVGTEEDVATLACTSNIALILCEQGFGTEYIPEVQEAQRHIVGLDERARDRQSILLSGPGIIACRRLLELHDAQLGLPECSVGRLRAAMRVVLDRMAQGHVT